ncbi:TPA: hypothetical protein MW178_001909 [Acinetobacter baumannii]|nr:hypothetical protein [Acinetobacter baumannii]
MNTQTSFIKKISNTIFSIRGFIYFITIFFITILGLILFLPFGKNNTFSIGNLHIVFKSINLGELGGFLSGIFAPLAFLWLILNMKQQDKNLEIAESQLNILMQEKENRRKALKATIKNTAIIQVNNPFPDEKDYEDYIINFNSDIKLISCYLEPFNESSPFIHIAARRTNHIFLSRSKKNIDAGEEFSIMVKIWHSSIDTINQQVNERIKIKYLDQDGYEQSNEILLIYTLTNIDTSKSIKRGILFALPT